MAAAGKARTSPLAKNAREGFAAVRNCFIAVGVAGSSVELAPQPLYKSALGRKSVSVPSGKVIVGLKTDLFATPHPNLPSREGTRADAQLAHSPRPIIAPTSQVGEVAVVRTSVSYKCGWGLNKTNPHPNLPQLGKECACVVRLAYIPLEHLITWSLSNNTSPPLKM